MKRLKLIIAALLALCLALGAAACNDETETAAAYYLSFGEEYAEADIPAAQRFTASGDTYTLTLRLEEGALITVRKADSGEVLGYSALFSARTELSEGAGGAIAVGKSGIYAFTLRENALSYAFTPEEEQPLPSTAVTGVALGETSLRLERGEEHELTATVLPETAANKNVVWASDDEAVVTVSNGKVKAVGYGTAKITVTTAEKGFTAECEVTVVKHVTALRFSASSLTLAAEGEAETLTVLFSPADATERAYTVTVTGDLSVEDDKAGTLTLSASSAGKATVSVSLDESPEISATCEVTVYAKGSAVPHMQSSLTTMIGDEAGLTVSLENGEIESVEWSASNETITVDGNGANATVTGVDFGTAVVTAKITAKSGERYTATCNVLVSDEWYFLYGYGLGAYDWDYADYISDKNAAERDGLLFTETERGVYTLTRYFTPDNGFQIIFPKVAGYTQHDDGTGEDVWNKNIPSQWVATSQYYSASNSDAQYVTNSTTYFCVNKPGVYTVILNLKGSRAKVSMKMVSLDVSFVDLAFTQGNATLKAGGEARLGFSVTPANAAFGEGDVEVTLSSEQEGFEAFLSYELGVAERELKLFVQAAPPQSFEVTLTLTVRGVSTSVKLYVLSQTEAEVPVSSVTFEEEHYYVNVNQGGAEGAWQQLVKAAVNEDATNQNVRYLDVTDYTEIRTQSADTRVTVNAETGLVTGKVLGTVKIKAVALADEAISDTCLVTFYSDVIYLIGGALSGVATNLGGWEPLDTSYKSVEGTAFEEEQLTMLSPTHFHLEYTFGSGQQFQLAFCGMDDKWVGAISMKNFLSAMSNVLPGWNREYEVTGDGKSMQTRAPLNIVLDLDLSKHMAFWTVNIKDRETFEGALLDYDGRTALKEGESVELKLYVFPDEGEEISYSLNDDSNVKLTYDEAAQTFTLFVQRAELSEDKEVTFTVTVKSKTLTVTFTVVAQHHLQLQWDDKCHWMGCTDEGCGYIDGEKVPHKKMGTLAANGEGHYTACSECGVQLGLQPHEYTLSDDGVFDFSDGMKQCTVCGFDLFQIEGNTLVAYYGKAETVIVPDVVTVIGDHAFDGHSELKELTYSSKLTKIGSYAFAGCSALKEIKIPNLVMEIGQDAFNGTAATVSWGHNPQIYTIGNRAFYGYLGTKLEIPSSVRYLGASCFAYSRIVSMVIPDNVENSAGIGTECKFGFQGCTSLQSIVIGKGITILQQDLFNGCTSLETVIVRGGKFYQIAANCFKDCTSIEAVYIERPLEELFTCNWLIMAGGADLDGIKNSEIKGKLYAYSAENPGRDPFGDAFSDYFGYFRDWFAGTWHWNGDSPQTDLQIFSHISLWDETAAFTPATLPALPALLPPKHPL